MHDIRAIRTNTAAFAAALRRYRRYAIVGMFVVAAILAPPDIITQIGLVIPLIALYEISIIVAGYVQPKPVKESDDA